VKAFSVKNVKAWAFGFQSKAFFEKKKPKANVLKFLPQHASTENGGNPGYFDILNEFCN